MGAKSQTELRFEIGKKPIPEYQLKVIEELKNYRYSQGLIDTLADAQLTEEACRDILHLARRELTLTAEAARRLL